MLNIIDYSFACFCLLFSSHCFLFPDPNRLRSTFCDRGSVEGRGSCRFPTGHIRKLHVRLFRWWNGWWNGTLTQPDAARPHALLNSHPFIPHSLPDRFHKYWPPPPRIMLIHGIPSQTHNLRCSYLYLSNSLRPYVYHLLTCPISNSHLRAMIIFSVIYSVCVCVCLSTALKDAHSIAEDDWSICLCVGVIITSKNTRAIDSTACHPPLWALLICGSV